MRPAGNLHPQPPASLGSRVTALARPPLTCPAQAPGEHPHGRDAVPSLLLPQPAGPQPGPNSQPVGWKKAENPERAALRGAGVHPHTGGGGRRSPTRPPISPSIPDAAPSIFCALPRALPLHLPSSSNPPPLHSAIRTPSTSSLRGHGAAARLGSPLGSPPGPSRSPVVGSEAGAVGWGGSEPSLAPLQQPAGSSVHPGPDPGQCGSRGLSRGRHGVSGRKPSTQHPRGVAAPTGTCFTRGLPPGS